jgi:hypothetical protein
MILLDLVLPSRINQKWTESGIDSYDSCYDKNHFLSYPHKITYEYNSRGFRDLEWPNTIDELKNAVWCIGDSFTVGLGSPIEHTWPYIVGKQLNRRVINVSMDGASNEWIARRAIDIYNKINPTNMIVMWSYFHRRESSDETLTDEQRRYFTAGSLNEIDEKLDLDNFLGCVNKVNRLSINCIHFIIPETGITPPSTIWDDIKGVNWPNLPPASIDEYNQLPYFVTEEIESLHQSAERELKQWFSIPAKQTIVPSLDLSRDGHHFGLLTSQWVAKQVADTWQVGCCD